ncbi:MAG: sialate O-acetylesterase [Kiritimatiellia bacterium]
MPARAALTLPAWLGDHLVVQAGQPVHLEGSSDQGGLVIVSAGDERVTSTMTGTRWTATLAARKASTEAFSIRIEAGAESVTIQDVLTGEVLLCAGQSNMDMPVARMETAAGELEDADRLGGVLRLLDFTACNPGKRAMTPAELGRLAEGRVYEGRWTVASRASASTFSAVGWSVARRVQHELGVPVGVVDVSVGGSPMMAWMSPESVAHAAPGFVPADWRTNPRYPPFARDRGGLHLRPATAEAEVANHPYAPGSLLRQLPWTPAARFRALLWYQGETDAELLDAKANAATLDALLDGFRTHFGPDAPPVCMVQLPRMNRPGWVEFREVQQKAADARDDVDLVPAIDTGDPADVHPRDKAPIAERLASIVVARIQGRPLPVFPRVGKVRFEEDGRAIVEITGADRLTREGPGESSGFALAGADRVFHPAQAEAAGAMMILHSPDVPRPVAMRYAWEPAPLVVWRNETGHPLSPARTDDW